MSHRAVVLRLAALAPLLLVVACAGRSNTVCRADIPLEDRQGLMLAPVAVDGVTVPGIFDTGAQTSAVTEALVNRLGLLGDDRHSSLMSGIGGEGTPQNDALVERLELAGYDPASGHYPVFAVPVDAGHGQPLGALIGADLISHFDIDLDVTGRQASLYDLDRCPDPPPDWLATADQVPLDISWTGRLKLTVQIDGHDVSAILDSGATATVVDLPAAERLGVTEAQLAHEHGGAGFGAAGVAFNSVVHTFRSLQIGREHFAAPHLSVLDRPLQEADMLLGLDWLRIHHVWISYRRHRLFIAPLLG